MLIITFNSTPLSGGTQAQLLLPLHHPQTKLGPHFQLPHQLVTQPLQVAIKVAKAAHIVECVACDPAVAKEKDKARSMIVTKEEDKTRHVIVAKMVNEAGSVTVLDKAESTAVT